MGTELNKIYESITSRLAFLIHKLKLNGTFNLQHLNIHSEDFFKDLLSLIYGYNLGNLNYDESNSAAIDLYDNNKKVAFQITTTGTKKKIDKTLSSFGEKGYYKKLDRLIILVIKERYKPNKCGDYKIEGFTFSYSEDVWDIKRIISDIKMLSVEKQNSIKNLICEHIAYPDGNSSIIPNYDALINTFIQDYSSLSNNINFAGRNDDLEILDNWLDSDKSHCLITSDAGVGKSALITNWYMSLDNEYSSVFIPISNRYQLNTQKIFYEILTHSLTRIYNTFVDLPPNPDFMFYKNECTKLLNSKETQKEKILLVIDGLDEAQWDIEKSISFLKGHVRIICTARDVIEHKSKGWNALIDFEENSYEEFLLKNLSFESVKEIVKKSQLFSNKQLEYASKKLYEATDGDALLLSLIIDEINEESGNFNLEYLGKIPKGYYEYFKDILGNDEIGNMEDFLCILALSKEPMELLDIQSVYRKANNEKKRINEKIAFGKVRRLINKINRKYTLTHPKLGYYLKEEYFKGTSYVDDYNNAFLMWGEEFFDKENVPDYLLKNLSKHILDVENLVQGRKLLHDNWRMAHANSLHRYSYYLNDIFNLRELVKKLYSRNKISSQEYIELFFKTSLIVGSIKGRGKAMGLESAFIAYKHNKVSYDYMKFLIDKEASMSNKLIFSVLSRECPYIYYSEIEGHKNEFGYWLILLEHPFKEVEEYANQKALNLIDDINIDKAMFEEIKQRGENITLEQAKWITKIERIWGYCKVNPNIKLAQLALDNIDYIFDPINKAHMKVCFNKILGNNKDYIREVLSELQNNQGKIKNISQLIAFLISIKDNVKLEVFDNLLQRTVNALQSADSFQMSILIMDIITILIALSKGEDNYWDMINSVIKKFPHSFDVCSALVNNIDYVHQNNKLKLIDLAFNEISKLRTGNNQVGLYSKLAKIDNHLKQKAIMLAIDASEKLDDYNSYFECKIKILLEYGSEKELYALLQEINIFYANYDLQNKFNNISELSKSQYEDFNYICIDNFIKELMLCRDDTIIANRYAQILRRAKEINYRYSEISSKALNYYLNEMEQNQLRSVNPNLLLPEHRGKLQNRIYEYFISVLPRDYSWQHSILTLISRIDSPHKRYLIDLLEQNLDKEVDKKNNIYYLIRLYKLTGDMKYYKQTIEFLPLLSESQRLHYYIILIGKENIYNDPDSILKTIFESECELDNDIEHRIIQYKYEGNSNNEIKTLVFDWLYTKDKEFVRERIRNLQNNELFTNSYKKIWALAKHFNIIDEMDISLMKTNDMSNIEIWSAIIESASENSRGSIFCSLPQIMSLLESDYKLILSKIDEVRNVWK